MIDLIKKNIQNQFDEKEWFIHVLKTGGWQSESLELTLAAPGDGISTTINDFEIIIYDDGPYYDRVNRYEVVIEHGPTGKIGRKRIRNEEEVCLAGILLHDMEKWVKKPSARRTMIS